jgi:type I restriction enzyme M protein
MAIILPHGVLFRGGAEERIRTKLLKDNNIDTIIGLPSNLILFNWYSCMYFGFEKMQKER